MTSHAEDPTSPTAVAPTAHQSSEVDRIAEEHFAEALAMSPVQLTDMGSTKRQDEYDDFSPAGHRAVDELNRRTLARLAAATPTDVIDKVTIAAMRERLGLEVETHQAGHHLLAVNNIATPLHAIRAVYDQMPTDSAEDWQLVARRLRAVPVAIDGWWASQQASVELGLAPARRQVDKLAEQVEQWAGPGGFLDALAGQVPNGEKALPAGLVTELGEAMQVAREAFRGAVRRLREELLPLSDERDGVGIERYRLASRRFLGARIDPAETYRWGLAEVARIRALEEQTVERIRPGAGIAEAVALLDADERYALHGTDALQSWMQQTADRAVADLADVHFDIPQPMRRVECCIAPTQDGGIYYTGPSEDFSRPGRMWWSVPEGVERFSTWRELTTVFHEGVPGHHLQVGQTALRSELLNRWRRMGCWVSGHGEGWALYSEWLMADLGYLDDPGHLMGMLDAQMLRAVRVVIDIGLHCGVDGDEAFEAPELVGGGVWDFEKAWRYFNHHVFMDEGFASFEVNRYAGWPGQAPSYKIGERLWLELRDEVRSAKLARGEQFSLKDFHRTALDQGSLGLDVLRAAVLDICGV